MEAFRQLLHTSQPLLLFLVVGLGYLLGQIEYRGFALGVAGVLFVGLAFGMWRPANTPSLEIADEITVVGLILFVYAVGLTTGPGFFSSFRQRGIRFNLAVVTGLVAGAALALVVGRWLGLSASLIAGVFSGALTNTPALAAVTQLLRGIDPAATADPTLGYSVAYPFGILGALLAFQIFAWCDRAELDSERANAVAVASGAMKVVSADFEIRNPALFDKAIGELRVQSQTGLILSRLRHGNETVVPTKYTLLREGDVVVAVGTQANFEKARDYFGSESEEHLELSRERIEMRRLLVSAREVVGRTLAELDLDRQFNAQVTRLRRVDVDIVPTDETVIELGDRIRVVAPRERMAEIARFFGESERELAELDYAAITLGISLGVLLGMVPIPISGGSHLSLGFAGGPLLAGLILGKIGRTGPVVWAIPLAANQAIRHLGLLLFLAGVGVTAGGRFLQAIATSGWQLLLLGALTTIATTAIVMLLLRRVAFASVIGTMGAASGMQTQPASLARAHEICQSDETYLTYALTYPVAMVGKILLAQLLVVLGHSVG